MIVKYLIKNDLHSQNFFKIMSYGKAAMKNKIIKISHSLAEMQSDIIYNDKTPYSHPFEEQIPQ